MTEKKGADYIISHNGCPYKILLPSDASEVLKFACIELKNFISEAAGVVLEQDSSPIDNQLYISIGNTPLYERCSSSFSSERMSPSTYRLKTVDKNILIIGGSDHGTLYGVYGFLNSVFGIEIFSVDTFKIPKNAEILYREIDILDSPDIEYRSLGFYNAFNTQTNSPGSDAANRLRVLGHDMTLRQRAGQTGPDVGSDIVRGVWGGLWAHTSLKILPAEKNNKGEVIHKDWYNEKLTQLCFTNPEMIKQFVKNLQQRILAYPNAPLFMVGIMDNDDYCECESCKESDLKYGGPSGTHIRFINAVAREIEKWRRNTLPDKTFKIAAFAYNAVKKAPVIMDDKTGQYVPVDESLIMEDNTALMLAPLDACALHDITAPCNKNVYERLKGWTVLCKTLLIWDYHTYFNNYFIYMPSIRAYKNNIALYKKSGAHLCYAEGNCSDRSPGFQDLKLYLLSKLMWNCQADTDTLIDEFMKYYYKGAAEYMKRYLLKLEKHYESLEVLYSKLGARGYHTAFDTDWQPDVLTQKHWPEDFLLSLERLLEEALLKIAETETGEEKIKIERRVKMELLTVKFLMIEIHTYYCSEEEFNGRVAEFEAMVKECDVVRLKHWEWHGRENVSADMLISRHILRWKCRYPNRVKHNG